MKQMGGENPPRKPSTFQAKTNTPKHTYEEIQNIKSYTQNI